MADMRLVFRLVFLLALFLIAFGCGSKMTYQLENGKSPQNRVQGLPTGGSSTVKGLTGSFSTTENTVVDLANETTTPVVLIFSQDTCLTCSEEADELRASLIAKDKAPSRVRVYTVLVGSNQEDALDWKKAHKVPWTVGYEPRSELLKQYCAEPKVPCTLVYTKSGGIVFTKIGKASFEELKALTGPWED